MENRYMMHDAGSQDNSCWMQDSGYWMYTSNVYFI